MLLIKQINGRHAVGNSQCQLPYQKKVKKSLHKDLPLYIFLVLINST